MQVVQSRDALEELFMAVGDVAEFVLHVCFRPQGCAEDGESLLLAGQTLVADPHIAL